MTGKLQSRTAEGIAPKFSGQNQELPGGRASPGPSAIASRLMRGTKNNSKRSVAEPDLDALMEAARGAAGHSYSPYSGFRVGAALLLENGAVVTGANVENVSFGLTICAERSALVRAVAEHGPAIRIQAMAVANGNKDASPPCGACRQMLAEFARPDAPVVFPAADGMCTMRFADLLPCCFETKPK